MPAGSAAYAGLNADDDPSERAFWTTAAFPHVLPSTLQTADDPSPSDAASRRGATHTRPPYEALTESPAGNTLLMRAVDAAITHYALGADAVPDLLAISIPLCWGWGKDNRPATRGQLFWQNKGQLAAAAVAGLVALSPQLLYWKTVSGQWLYYGCRDCAGVDAHLETKQLLVRGVHEKRRTLDRGGETHLTRATHGTGSRRSGATHVPEVVVRRATRHPGRRLTGSHSRRAHVPRHALRAVLRRQL